ncbi:MAG TPA: succinyl-diaminopimelate desuccinylase [Microbacteriaceae bacterium]|nr:succinyl-diaminopimelate desuccinylase [Microbacteriaceae bacterium]
MTSLDLRSGSVELTRALCDIESVSGAEGPLADAIEAALRPLSHLQVIRDGNTLIARTQLGRPQRIIIAGHIDTVPINDNLPTREVEGEVWGRGTVDMKAGVAVQLTLAAELTEPRFDLTWVWYDNEEVASDLNGLGRVARTRPELLSADFGILGEPSNGIIEGGCNGTIRVELRTRGTRAHSARAWMGHNAIHDLHSVLARLAAFESATVRVDGLDYREGLNAVRIRGGVAGNVIPDEAVVEVNYRFAPNRRASDAVSELRALFPEVELDVVDASEGARPGLDAPLAVDLITAVGVPARAKYGWTDVARLSSLGIPAVNFGPGNPSLAHADDERVSIAQIRSTEEALRTWLS